MKKIHYLLTAIFILFVVSCSDHGHSHDNEQPHDQNNQEQTQEHETIN